MKFDGKDFLVPAGFLGQPVVRQDVGAFLRRAEVGNLDRWDLGKSQQLGGLDPSVPGDNLVVLVNQERLRKGEDA